MRSNRAISSDIALYFLKNIFVIYGKILQATPEMVKINKLTSLPCVLWGIYFHPYSISVTQAFPSHFCAY
jgi:hypothetical protein